MRIGSIDGIGDRLERRAAAPHPGVGERRDEPATGSLSSNAPSSHSISAATDVIGLVIE